MGKATRPSSGCGIWTSYKVQNADPYGGSRFLRGLKTQREWWVGNEEADRRSAANAVAKMAYEILVWVLVLRTWFLRPAALQN